MTFDKLTTSAIRNWLKSNNFCVKCRIGNIMAYNPDTKTILVPKIYDSQLDSYFMQFLRKYGLKYDFDAITLSILHELGHFITEDDFTEDEWNMDAIVKSALAYTDDSDEEYIYKYWHTDTEFAANMWLINFVNTHYHIVENLEEILETTLKDLYK